VKIGNIRTVNPFVAGSSPAGGATCLELWPNLSPTGKRILTTIPILGSCPQIMPESRRFVAK